MSCNQQFFKSATEVIVNTWIKDCIDYSNIKYYIYSGGYESSSINNYNVECSSPDDLDNTFIKTVECFDILDAYRYDYVVRTNTSTFINVGLLNDYLINKFNSDNKDLLCCGDLAILRNNLQLRGNSIIFPKWFIPKITEFDIKNLPEDIENTHDDVVISYIYQQEFSNKPNIKIFYDDVDYVPCLYLNDNSRVGHPLAIYDDKVNIKNLVSKFIFIAYRKNNGDRYHEFGECYKLYNINRNITNDNKFILKYNQMKLVWLYDIRKFIKI